MTIDHALLEQVMAPAIVQALDFAGRRESLAVEEKTRGDFVSQADREVEQLIRASLHAALGEVALLGEEGGGSLDNHGTGWTIDPIDGTSNFLRGLPLWGISIGYLEQWEPRAGIIALPELGVRLSAVRGAGVHRNGVPFQRPPAPPGVNLFAIGENDHEPGAQTDARAASLRAAGFRVVRYYCASVSLASAALGWTDGYVEHGCGLWDIVAGAAIAREAGLAVDIADIGVGRWSVDVRR